VTAWEEKMGLHALYGQLYFAPEAAFARLSAAELTAAVLTAGGSLPGASLGPAASRNGSFCAAQFVVSADPPPRFDPELSMREPLELQVWPDGSFVVEIEFTGPDVRTQRASDMSVAAVLAPWASARGWQLLSLFNDRGRSLPDVWNAAFGMLDTSRPVTDALEFARRAISVAEVYRYEGQFAGRLLELLRAGDAQGLIGTPITAVFQPRATVPADAQGDFRLALDVCAFANSVPGGLVVLGLQDDGARVTGVLGGPAGEEMAGEEVVARIGEVLQRLVFPVPEGVRIETAPSGAAGAQAVVAVLVPPQEQLLRPFLVCGTIVGDQLSGMGVTLVERRHATIYTHGVVALHSQLAAGRALLGGPPQPTAG
jgi:hypothetical protein